MIKNLYKLIFNDKKSSDLEHEKSFLDHHKKCSNVMKEITQTSEQKNDFYKVTVNNSFNRKETSSADIIQNINIATEPVEYNKEVCTAVIAKTIKLNKDMINNLYRLIFNDKKSSDLEHEKSFLDHHKKFSHVMEEITQTSEQKKNFYKVTINNSFNRKETSSTDIIQNINIATEPVEYNKEVCAAFIEKALKVNKKLVIKDYDQKKFSFQTEMNSVGTSEYSEIANTKNMFQKVSLSDNPHFQESLHVVSSALEKASIPIISILIHYSQLSELLTFMSMSQTLSVLMGFRIFSKVYYSFLEPGSFQLYLKSLESLLLNSEHSLTYKIVEIIKPTRPYLLPIICTAIGGGLGFIYNNYLEPVIPKIPTLSDMEKYIPNAFLRKLVKEGNELTQGFCFSVGRTIGNARDSLFVGLFGKHFAFFEKAIETIKDNIPDKKKN